MSADQPETRLTPERWREVEALFLATRDRSPDDRARFLAQACGTDAALRLQVESLLAADQGATRFLDPPGDSAPLPPDFETTLRAQLAGRYGLQRELGRGGMATVYLADDVRHHRQVAIKVLHPELGAVLGAERFLREIGIVARLSHPHILPLHDSGTLDLGLGRPVLFYVMPYIAGRSLRERLREEPQLPIDEALGIARQVADALEHAHRQGVIHRDIKPENILLADGQAVLADFGIARALGVAGGDRLTETGLAIGTPTYMGPEQSAGSARVDARSDIYALGCVLYEMLAGQPPFSGPTAQAILARHAMDPVPSLRTVRPTVPVALGRAVTRALAKVPADRFPTAKAFGDALQGAANAVEPDRPGMRLRPRWLLLGVAALALALGVGRVLRKPAAAGTADSKLVVVLPFRISGASPELAWLREGLVDLLAIKLTREGGMRAADPTAVLSAWHRAPSTAGNGPAPNAGLAVARGLGAGRVTDGSVVGTAEHLTLTATLLATSDGHQVARASAEGPVDSLSVLVDRLAARLLSLEAGVEGSQLSSITSSSLPAIRAYLSGRAAFRSGRLDEAFRQFREATLLDSTFALAALELLHTSTWVNFGGKDAQRARRLALDGRGRLSPADRTLLDASTGPHPTAPEMFERWREASSAYPGRADTWYALGDNYYHWGLLAGLADPMRLADDAFRRGWAVDSASTGQALASGRSAIWAEPLVHMVEIAQMREDTASVLRLVAQGLAADSVGPQPWYLRWHRAVALGDSARRAFWADSKRIDPGAFALISHFIVWTGVGSQDYVRAINLDIQQFEAANPSGGNFSRFWSAMNGGRPRTAADSAGDLSAEQRIRNALYWGADTTVGERAALELAPYANPTSFSGEDGKVKLGNLIALAEWRAARGDYGFAQSAARRLRTARVTGLESNDSLEMTYYVTLCASLLDAIRATALRLPDARARLDQADADARSYVVVLHSGPPANLIIARLAEAQGDLPFALRAVRRRMVGFGLGPWYISTFLREEGRLAALVGDTGGAVRAYQHYLALRPDPESALKPEVAHVREELARLVGEHAAP